MADDDVPEESDLLTIKTRFVRGRNVLYAKADFGQLYVDYYLHLKDYQIAMEPEADRFLKTALALFSLHCISRPRNDVLAWTINFQQPLLNLFLAGDTGTGDVVGRAYTENVKQAPENSFYQDLVRRGREPHRSVVSFAGGDMVTALETFYHYSEQRPARFFQLSEHRFAILSAHPDWDEAWFRSVDLADVIDLDQREELSLLETRLYRWGCGCSSEKLLRVIAPMLTPTIDALFEGDESLTANCPRCGARYILTREAAEAYLAQHAATE